MSFFNNDDAKRLTRAMCPPWGPIWPTHPRANLFIFVAELGLRCSIASIRCFIRSCGNTFESAPPGFYKLPALPFALGVLTAS